MTAFSSFPHPAHTHSPDIDLPQKAGASQRPEVVGSTARTCPVCNVTKQALDAARRFVATGEAEQNPYRGFLLESAWRSAFDRNVLALSAGVEVA